MIFHKKTFTLGILIIFSSLFLRDNTLANAELDDFSSKTKEIIELGYVPNEIIVKFDEKKINIRNKNGKMLAEDFLEKQSGKIAEKVMKKMEKNPQKSIIIDNLNEKNIPLIKKNFLKNKKELPFLNSMVLELDIDNSAKETIEELKNQPNIIKVIPNYIFLPGSNPPSEIDFSNGNLWGLYNDGGTVTQSIATNAPPYQTNNPPSSSDADIKISQAWNITTGGTGKTVAIIDSGVNYNHPDLAINMWSAPDEECIMGYNEEEEPIIEDCPNHGWDFAYDDNDPQDDLGHGTHIAGIIGGRADNGGIVGVNQSTKMMAIKVGTNFFPLDAVLSGIEFAINNDANIINASFGSTIDDEDMKAAIEEFMNTGAKGRLFVTIAQNYSWDNDDAGGENHIYPSDYNTFSQGIPDNLISVAATDQEDALYNNSDYGVNSVDLGAPGTNILSTYIEPIEEINENFSNGIGEGKEFDKDDNDDPNNWYPYGNVVFTDTADYQSGVQNASLLSNTHDLSDALDDTAVLKFEVWCDTEPESDDYLNVYVTDGNNTDQINKIQNQSDPINEENSSLDTNWTVEGYNGKYGTVEYLIPNNYLSDNISFDFAWNTDGSNTGGPYRGCYIDNVRLSWVEAGYRHYYKNGTSMSAGFVSGVAALLWNEYPDLTAHQVKDILMASGDHVTSLEGKTVSENRLNAYRALQLAEVYNESGIRVYENEAEEGREVEQDGTYDFGNTAVGRLAVIKFIIQNSGTENLELYGDPKVIVSGANADEFEVVSQPDGEVGFLEETQFRVSFNPTSEGAKSAVLSFVTNRAGYNPFVINLTGNALPEGSVIVNPTIHSVPEGGNWYDEETWVEGRIPTESDQVEINGEVYAAPPDGIIRGLLINPGGEIGKIMVWGDIINNGIINWDIYVSGSIENNGSAENYYFIGQNSHSVSGSVPPKIYINGTAVFLGDINAEMISMDAEVSFVFGEENTLTVAGINMWNLGSITGGTLELTGGDILGSGLFDVSQVNVSGTVYARDNINITGNAEIEEGAYLSALYSASSSPATRTVKISGDLVNNGTIENYITQSDERYLEVMAEGNLTNTGSITADIYASWPEVAGAEGYEFQRTDENLNWLDPIPVSTAYYSINNLVSTSHMWRSRAITGGTAGEWSAVHYINMEPVPEITVKAGGTEIVSGGSVDMGSLTEGHWKAVSLNVSNDGLTELEVTGMNITGSDAGEFVLIGAPGVIPAGESQEIIVGLIGGSVGVKSAALEITSNDEDEGVYIVNLSAQVVEDTGEIISEPTAEQESAGNWSDPGVWAEGEIPGEEDIAGIITNIILDLPEVILQGLIIEEGGVLEPGSLIAYHPESSSLFASLAEIFTPSAMAEGEEVVILRILDDFVNRGTVKDSVSASLHLYIGKNFKNTGSMENSEVFVFWPEVTGATEYEVQLAEMTDNGSGVLIPQWQEAVRVAENFYSIKNLVNSSMIWHARAVFAGSAEGGAETYGQWTPVYSINAVYVPAPEAEMRDGSDAVLGTNENADFGQITFEEPMEKLFTIRNTGTRDMSVSNLSMTGDPNFSLQIIDGSDFTLAPGEVKAFGLHFMAEEEEEPGMRNAVFTFNTSDSSKGLFTINMTGEVIPAVDPVPVLTEVTAIPSPTTDRTPDYTFNSSEAGTISYEGGCESDMAQAAAGDNTITFNPLLPGTYDSCFITVTDSAGGVSEPLAVSAFSVDQPSTAEADWETIISDLTLWQSQHADDLPEFLRVKLLEDRIAKYHFFLEKGKVRVAALFGRKAVKVGYPDIEGMVSELRQAFEEEDVSEDVLKRILIKLVWIEWHFTGEVD